MSYQSIIKEVSDKLNLPKELVDKAYKAFWLFIRNHIESLPLKESISEEDFNKLRTNFNIPSIGKLYVTWDKLGGTKNKFKMIKELKARNDKD